MRTKFEIAVILVIASLVVAVCVGQTFPQASGRHDPSAGCHERRGKAPAPTSTHDCCLSGHDAAVLRAYPVHRPVTHDGHADSVITSPITPVSPSLETPLTLTVDMPRTTTLRI